MRMRQGFNPNEVGAPICRFPSGQLAFGPWRQGDPMGVSVTTQCPNGSQFWGIYHTHPRGVPMPSDQDIKSGVESKARVLCINATSPANPQGKMRCFVRGNLAG